MSEDRSQKMYDGSEKNNEDSGLFESKDASLDNDSRYTLSVKQLEAVVDKTLSDRFAYIAMTDRQRRGIDRNIKLMCESVDTTDIMEIEVDGQYTSEAHDEQKYVSELDEIFTQLQDADRDIARTRRNTVSLGIETRSMLKDLRKQLG